jgi:hypothetical protein
VPGPLHLPTFIHLPTSYISLLLLPSYLFPHLPFSFFLSYLSPPPFPFLFLFSTSIEHKKDSRGLAGPPEARGPRHVPFVPLLGSGTGEGGILFDPVLKMKNCNIAIVLITSGAYKKRYWLRISLVTYCGEQIFKNLKKAVLN